MIGGQLSGGNDPTAGVIVRPPQGNLISGNRGNGVRMTGGAHGNTMSGNFVGTDGLGQRGRWATEATAWRSSGPTAMPTDRMQVPG